MTQYAGGPADSPGFLFWHVTLAWQRAVGAALQPLGLTHVQFVLLASAWWLNRQGQVPNQLQLARQAGADVKMASQVIRKLEGKGLLRREVDPIDTRARKLRPTRRGENLALRAIRTVEQVDTDFFGAEAGVIVPVLRRLAAAQPST